MKLQNLEFKINYCQNSLKRKQKGLKDCIEPTDERFTNFIRDLQVDFWAIYDDIDYSKY